MRYWNIAWGAAIAVSSQRVAAMHLLNGGYFIPQNGDLQFSHMGKVFPQQQEQVQTNAEQSQNRETVEPTLQPGTPNNT